MCFCRFGRVSGCFKNGFALEGCDNHLAMLLECLYVIVMKNTIKQESFVSHFVWLKQITRYNFTVLQIEGSGLQDGTCHLAQYIS